MAHRFPIAALALALAANLSMADGPKEVVEPQSVALTRETISAPTVQQLVEGIVRHHPEFRATLARTDQAAGLQQVADAAFDARITQDTSVRASGYYDGSYAKQTISQPIAAMNGELFGSYRIAGGQFPVYEAEFDTLDLGEASMGIRLSLLQNRVLDERRIELQQAAWKLLAAQSKQDVELNKLVYAGVSSYLNWYQSFRRLGVIRDLVRITQERFSGIEARVDSGDLAQISLTEFQSTLLRRQLLEREAEQRFELAKQQLAYFWRVSNSAMATPQAMGQPPQDIGWPYKAPSIDLSAFDDQIAQHPSVSALNAQLEQARNQQRLARNEVLPQLDLELKVARDIGQGIEPLTGNDSIIGLSFSVPIGQRAARARESIAAAGVRELEFESVVLTDQLRRDVALSLEALDYGRRILAISREQEAVAEQLQRQEQERFEAGVSDLFLLINRETAALQAHLKSVDAEVDLMRQELALQATLAQLLPSA